MFETEDFEIMYPQSYVSIIGRDRIIYDAGKEMMRTPEDADLARKIEDVWLREGFSFSGPKIRLSHHALDKDGNLVLELALTNYKEFIGTNMEASKDLGYRQELVGRGLKRFNDKYAFFSNMIGLNCVVETSDEKLIVGLRDKKTRAYPDYWHLVAGSADMESHGQIDLFAGMVKEIEEELFLSEDKIYSLGILGLARNKETLHPTVIFYSKINPELNEILCQQNSGTEHRSLMGFEKENLHSFLLHEKVVPDGKAGLTLYQAYEKNII